MDQEALANRARSGDRDALRQLCAAYHPRLCNYLYHMTGSRQEAEDLAQETLLAMIRGLSGYRRRPGAGFEGWIYRIAHNQWASQARRGRTPPLPQDYDPPDPGPGPEGALIIRERERALALALEQLEPDLKEMVILRYQMDMGHAQIGMALGMSPAKVKWRLHDALGKLRRLMKEDEAL